MNLFRTSDFGIRISMRLVSSTFQNNQEIPAKYTCEGQDISPPLTVVDSPSNASSFVLTVTDPDAPNKTWIHWVVFNIDPTVTDFVEGSIPDGGIEGLNDFGTTEYGGPCPPTGTHRYFFRLYALDSMLDFDEGEDYETIMDFVQKHKIAEAEIIGLFNKSSR